ncbi:MAG: cell division protein SepF [Lachnospiraceae bacterium]|nr:cell division protein SepF [Lachnospiraceae bacterium]
MSFLDRFLDRIKLSDDYDDDEDFDEEDDFEDDYEEKKPKKRFTGRFRREDPDDLDDDLDFEEPKKRAKTEKKPAKSKSSSRLTSYDDEFENSYEEPAPKPKSRPKKQFGRKKSASSLEVNVVRPSSMEDAREIADTLLDSCTVVLNLEGIDVDLAQRIIDFTCGACYSLDGSLQKISNYIFILTPAGVEISGDYQSILSGAFNLPPM